MNIEHLGLERGHRTLVITRKGGKVVTMPPAPRTARAIDLAIGERTDGPLFVTADEQRLDRIPRGQAAVTNGLTLAHSSGAVKGNICRVKALKRRMFGRANLDPLRKRILSARRHHQLAGARPASPPSPSPRMRRSGAA